MEPEDNWSALDLNTVFVGIRPHTEGVSGTSEEQTMDDSARWRALRWAGLDMTSALSPQITDQSWTGVASAVLTRWYYRTRLIVHSSR